MTDPEEKLGVEDEEEEVCVSVPRGGPIYVANMVGPIVRVPQFESLVYNQLQDLKNEIGWDSIECSNEDISVDELKIITEEELVNKAFEVAFKDDEVTGNSSQVSENHSNAGKPDDGRTSSTEHANAENSGRGIDSLLSNDSLKGSPPKSVDYEESSQNNSKKSKRKRKRPDINKTDILEENYMEKVEQISRIKQKQDEDKEATRLHSFNGSCRIIERTSASSYKTGRITSQKSLSSKGKMWSSNAHEHVPVHYPETVLCIEVYHNKRTFLKTQEFLVLGGQPLNELKDKIYCLTDEVMKDAGQHDPSGYFLIEDLFCNDLREPSAVDYSKPIRDWLRDSREEALEKWECIVSGELQPKQKAVLGSNVEQQLPRFKAVQMHQTRFCDLRFRLGAGYLYCHQGDCKHAIVIRDMRLINPKDVQNRADYPVVTFQTKLRFRKCSVCKIYKAKKMTVDDKWAPENPCYFCDLCYYMLHYVNGSLLYNEFSVYDYYHE